MPEAAPQILIRNNIAESINSISIADNYNTDIAKVFVGKFTFTDRFSDADRRALVQIRIPSETYGSDNTDGQGRIKSIRQDASLTVLIMASMKDTTEQDFWSFLNDLRAAIAKCPDRDLMGNNYRGIDTTIESIIVDSSTEKDELEDTLSLKIHEQIAEITVICDYLFISEMVSGTP